MKILELKNVIAECENPVSGFNALFEAETG